MSRSRWCRSRWLVHGRLGCEGIAAWWLLQVPQADLGAHPDTELATNDSAVSAGLACRRKLHHRVTTSVKVNVHMCDTAAAVADAVTLAWL
jgi:hypothetical protein